MFIKMRSSKPLTITLLWLGDLLLLVTYAFEFEYFDSNPRRPAFDLIIAFLPLITAWCLAVIALHANKPTLSWWIFLKRSALCWSIAIITSYTIQYTIFWISMRRIHLPLPVLIDGLGGLAVLIIWRSGYKIFYDLVTLPRFAPFKKVVWGGLAFVVIILIAIPIPWLYNLIKFSTRIYSIEAAPQRPVVLVLGAGVWANGTPSSLLEERIRVASSLYHLGKVGKLLLTADNRPAARQETDAMRQLALNLGVPESDLILDPAGFSTSASCQRAGSVYQITSVLIVSQSFQLPRALSLCDSFGLEVAGVSSDKASEHLKSLIFWHLREIPAAFLAWYQVNLQMK